MIIIYIFLKIVLLLLRYFHIKSTLKGPVQHPGLWMKSHSVQQKFFHRRIYCQQSTEIGLTEDLHGFPPYIYIYVYIYIYIYISIYIHIHIYILYIYLNFEQGIKFNQKKDFTTCHLRCIPRYIKIANNHMKYHSCIWNIPSFLL